MSRFTKYSIEALLSETSDGPFFKQAKSLSPLEDLVSFDEIVTTPFVWQDHQLWLATLLPSSRQGVHSLVVEDIRAWAHLWPNSEPLHVLEQAEALMVHDIPRFRKASEAYKCAMNALPNDWFTGVLPRKQIELTPAIKRAWDVMKAALFLQSAVQTAANFHSHGLYLKAVDHLREVQSLLPDAWLRRLDAKVA